MAAAHNSGTIAQICRNSGKETENGTPESFVLSDFSYDKIQDGGHHHFEFPQNAITQMLVEVHLRNLVQT